MTATSVELRSEIRSQGSLELSLVEVPLPEPGEHEVLVRMEGAPINPSDLGLLFGAADMTTARYGGTRERPTVSADVPEQLRASMAGRVDQSMPVGNEGAGVVIATGSSDVAKALLGKTVALVGGATYAQHRCVPAFFCLELPEGVTPKEGASCFVNPLTALGMVETLRDEGHKALVHTAAASNLGQMLLKICAADGVDLVNIVRKPEQVEILRGLGAKYVCNSSDANFNDELTDALATTGATLAFDATGGGTLASQILGSMEAASNRNAAEYSRYGSTTHKQVYIYGQLDRSRTELDRDFGYAWGLGGWLLTPFLQRITPERGQALRARVAAEIRTTFASHYTSEISLAGALREEAIRTYGRQATGEKYLINPQLEA